MTTPTSGPDEPTIEQGVEAEGRAKERYRSWILRLVGVLWIAIGVVISIPVVEGAILVLEAARRQGAWWAILLATLRLVAFVGLLGGTIGLGALVTNRFLRHAPSRSTTGIPGAPAGVGFPTHPTIPVGIWIALITIFLTVGLIEVLGPNFYILERFPNLACATGDDRCVDARNLILSIFASGVGSMLTTIAGYLEHASEKRDFEYSYIPWYAARPAVGMLLGIVYYFVIKGGLFITVGEVRASELNEYGLAALGALVGMFSKQATEKLREVFETLFVTREQVKDEQKKESTSAGVTP